MEKERVDVLAVKQGLFETREQAKRSVMAGLIYNEKNERFDKPGEKIPVSSELRVKGKKLPYVSRGGLKLEKALKAFDLSVEGKTLLDIGASTGGFTDAALQNGAKMSYALDVGYNQLAWKIRQDPRVVVMERVNFRYAKPEDFTLGIPEVAVIDDGSYHEVDSSEMAFHIAGSMAFKDAMHKGNPILLEPIMKVEVTMPEDYMGDVIGDINSRRGRIEGMEDIGGGKMVRAYVPLSEMFGYSTDLRSRTQGRGNYSMFFDKYEPVPKNVQEKVLSDHKK